MTTEALWSDLILPAELTGYARAAQEDYERQWGTLARYLPNEYVPDIVARFEVGKAGLLPVAPFRSYDAETPLGKLQGRQRVTIELPPIGEKLRVSEYDQLRFRGNTSQTFILNAVLDITRQIVRDVNDRLEVARGQAIETGELDVDENGFVQSADWERDPSLEVAATNNGGSLWSDPDDATPLADLDAWCQHFQDVNNMMPGSLLTSRTVVRNLARTAEMRNLYASLVGRPSVINRNSINEVLADNDIPPIDIYERHAVFDNGDGDGEKVRSILSPNKIFLLPAPVDPNSGNNGFGATYWGQTLEADEPEYGLQPEEQPGIVAGTWKTRDPIGVWVHCNAIGLPVLGDANRSLVATVLADAS
ncbi:MAG TPA: major capsid protein [Mycobacterium sp.]|nr:major capsid protein [Mycobacterium sp.]